MNANDRINFFEIEVKEIKNLFILILNLLQKRLTLFSEDWD